MENRVYDIELEDSFRGGGKNLIAKFYRPGRWTRDQIQDEHDFIHELETHEIPAIAPLILDSGQTLGTILPENIHFAVFPKVGGRSPALADLGTLDYSRLGQLLGRMHNIGAAHQSKHRLVLNEKTYGRDSLAYLLNHNFLPDDFKKRYEEICLQIFLNAERSLRNQATLRLHGDCHVGNVLMRDEAYTFLDFDDMVVGPSVQDFWLLLPGRMSDCPDQVEALLRGYEVMRAFPNKELGLIEVLRSLRMIHFSGWIGRRYKDPAFRKQFPDFGSPSYWNGQIQDLYEQIELIS